MNCRRLLCRLCSYLDRVHGVHHRVLQYASHGSGCHVGHHGSMRRQTLVVPVHVHSLAPFALALRHLQRCHRPVRAQLHAWRAPPRRGDTRRDVGGVDNHNTIATSRSSSARMTWKATRAWLLPELDQLRSADSTTGLTHHLRSQSQVSVAKRLEADASVWHTSSRMTIFCLFVFFEWVCPLC